MNRIVTWLLKQWHGTPIPRDSVPPQPPDNDGLEMLARLIESDDPVNFDEIARRLEQ